MGSIEAGKLANMIVLTKNPLAKIDDLRSIVMTVKRGRVFERNDSIPLQEGDIIDF